MRAVVIIIEFLAFNAQIFIRFGPQFHNGVRIASAVWEWNSRELHDQDRKLWNPFTSNAPHLSNNSAPTLDIHFLPLMCREGKKKSLHRGDLRQTLYISFNSNSIKLNTMRSNHILICYVMKYNGSIFEKERNPSDLDTPSEVYVLHFGKISLLPSSPLILFMCCATAACFWHMRNARPVCAV